MRGRGCVLGLILSISPAFATEAIIAPSGQTVTLSEILLDENPGELWVRFRFLAPQITPGPDAIAPDTAIADMQVLCDDLAAPYLVDNAIAPARIVMSFSDREVPFGQPDPDATQFFELFSLQDGACIWEEF
ncbi:DUF6497 family protein [Aestuariivita boseongensis]|uniref:DUF6497 family protein n=1 Tax=Aestuariivita boseongensis TaxID=1470562 RepID=UPI000B1FF495|nr:DUF6497 family protein [Aestuariivita boseongensis]